MSCENVYVSGNTAYSLLDRKQGCDIVSFWKSGIGEYLHSVKWYKFLSGKADLLLYSETS